MRRKRSRELHIRVSLRLCVIRVCVWVCLCGKVKRSDYRHYDLYIVTSVLHFGIKREQIDEIVFLLCYRALSQFEQ